MNDTTNYYKCVGTLCHLIALELRSPGTSLKHTINLLYRASLTCTIFTPATWRTVCGVNFMEGDLLTIST